LRSASSSKPFIVYPNSGRVWDAKNKVWTGSGSAGFSDQLISEWVGAGAQFIGGCCGIGASEINDMSIKI
jgi:homocysteine S-methyltransferase